MPYQVSGLCFVVDAEYDLKESGSDASQCNHVCHEVII